MPTPLIKPAMSPPTFQKEWWGPRYWLIWLGVFFVWSLAKLPWAIQLRLGVAIGWLAYKCLGRRVDDTRTNLRMCFPEKNETEREAMVRDVFRNAGLTVFETTNAWFRPVEYYRNRVTFEGLEHLERLQAEGRSILMLGAHYSMLDLGGDLAALHFKVNTVYRPQKNPLINFVVARGRCHTGQGVIPNHDMRGLIRALKKKVIVWYATDQDYGIQHAVFVPFFGVPAATITTPSRMARMNNAALLLIQFNRLGDEEKYQLRLTPALENFPSAEGDEVADTARLNLELEKLIRIAPTQYMWYHRRFKTLPPGGKFPYHYKPKEIRRRKEAARAAERTQEKQ
jgi:KDO2-lipid IV(A) lauroyltransferase